MANACALPVAVAGALMPDAHVGYGLPIGGAPLGWETLARFEKKLGEKKSKKSSGVVA
jgi:hypothetical protein